MNELIKISKQQVGNEEVNAVSSTQLWETLEVKSDHRNWIKNRINDLQLIENIDFIVSVKNERNPSGGRPSKDYILTLDAAKHIAMAERNEKGKQVRMYFIEVEKKFKNTISLPTTYLDALKQLVETEEKKQIAEAKVKELKPKADFFDAVADSKTAIEMSAVAKTLDLGFGRNKLFEILRDKYILRQNNEPFQKYIDAGYFRVIEQKYNLPDGSIQINLKTLVYQKGLNFIRGLLEDAN